MASVAVREGKPDSATALLRESLAIDEQLYGNVNGGNHPALAESWLALGRHLIRFGDAAEAEEDLRRSVRMFEASASPQPDMHGSALLALAGLMRDQGRTEEALALYAQAAALLQGALGDGSLLEGNVQVDWAELLVRLGRHSEAVPFLESALATYQRFLPSDHARDHADRRPAGPCPGRRRAPLTPGRGGP